MEAWLLRTESDRGGGALAITLHVCRRNVVILDSPCQAISLIMALIWNVGLWFAFLPILPPSPPPPPTPRPHLPHKVVSSTSITIARGNLSIRLAHPPSLCFWVFADTWQHLHVITAGPRTRPVRRLLISFYENSNPVLWDPVYSCHYSLRLLSHWRVALIVISDPAECLAVQILVLLRVHHPDPQHQESLDSEEETETTKQKTRGSALIIGECNWWRKKMAGGPYDMDTWGGSCLSASDRRQRVQETGR